jgi:hypothetical protein
MERDSPELLSLADYIDDSLVSVGLETPDFQAAEFGFP